MTYKKIIITGTSGSGKTTLASQLAKKMDIPCFDLDDFFWLPGWIPRNKADFENDILTISEKNKWIISGNYSPYSHITWPKADMIVWLDFPLHTLLWRTLLRSVKRSITKETCCGGNQESFSRLFSRNTIFYWVLKSYSRRKKRYSAYFDSPHDKPHKLVRLCTKQEVELFLSKMPRL